MKYGPVYNLNHWLAREDDTCRTWWWAGLLYSQNYINPLHPVSIDFDEDNNILKVGRLVFNGLNGSKRLFCLSNLKC